MQRRRAVAEAPRRVAAKPVGRPFAFSRPLQSRTPGPPVGFRPRRERSLAGLPLDRRVLYRLQQRGAPQRDLVLFARLRAPKFRPEPALEHRDVFALPSPAASSCVFRRVASRVSASLDCKASRLVRNVSASCLTAASSRSEASARSRQASMPLFCSCSSAALASASSFFCAMSVRSWSSSARLFSNSVSSVAVRDRSWASASTAERHFLGAEQEASSSCPARFR